MRPKGIHQEAAEARAIRLQYQAWLSEKNRRVRLEARPDATARLAAAEQKRAFRNLKRSMAICV